MNTALFILMKFGAEEHMDRLLRHGELFFNPVERMRAYEAQTGRGDLAEGRSFIMNYPAGTFAIDFIPGRQFRYEHLQVAGVPTGPLGNVYCLYCLARHHTVGLSEFTPDRRCARFGSHVVIIKHLPKFFKRVNRALDARGLEHRNAIVRYYDVRTYSGPLSVFHKPMEFAYQQELRFHVVDHSGKPFFLTVGNLTDIAELHPISALAHFKATPKGLPHVSEALRRITPSAGTRNCR